MRLRSILVGAVLAHLVACYEPQVRNCTLACSGPGQCAAGQTCTSDGYCAAPEISSCREYEATLDAAAVVTDAETAIDASGNDNTVCLQGCSSGTCDSGVCVIDCTAPNSCANDVVCPANLPCRVECGDTACGGKINCTKSTSCTVQCTGEDSCDDEIQCPPGEPCDVTCSGAGSCVKRTKCKDSCSCDVRCTGMGSCAEPSECQEALCRIGNGCTSTVLTCDTCN